MKVFRHVMHTLSTLLMPKFLQKRMISCEKVAYLLANSDSNSLLTKIQVRMHIMMCQHCYDYEKQLKIINQECNKLRSTELTPEETLKIKSSKEEMLKKYGS